jgi:hypothetical protein
MDAVRLIRGRGAEGLTSAVVGVCRGRLCKKVHLQKKVSWRKCRGQEVSSIEGGGKKVLKVEGGGRATQVNLSFVIRL